MGFLQQGLRLGRTVRMLAGIWLALSAFWLGYGDPLKTTHIAIGGLVVISGAVEGWQDREDIEASP